MKKKVAIFVDWENIRKGIFEQASKKHKMYINYNNVDNVLKFIEFFIDKSIEEIYRIFIYLCEPYGGIVDGIDYKTTPIYNHSINFIEKIQSKDYIALRKGKIQYRGLDKNNQPIFDQKQVDMLLGLDIAHVAYNKLVDRVMIFSCDLDVIPAMKVARINGLQVIWACCPDIVQTSNEIKRHSDFVREKDFLKIFLFNHQ